MCNVPCSLCGDYDNCEIKDNQIFMFDIFKNKEFKLHLLATKKEAQEFSLFNPEYTLILNIDNIEIANPNYKIPGRTSKK